MQEAADAILWETFQVPGPTDQIMLPPQPSRNASLEGRKVSFGQPLQLIDSNVVLPYKGKGKGRARDWDLTEHNFNAWEEANMGGAGSFDASGPDVNFVAPSGEFTFVPGQIQMSFQPPTDSAQQPFAPSQTLNPGTEMQPPQIAGPQSPGPQNLPQPESPTRSGYHFQPCYGFVCQVCYACVPQPGVHRIGGHVGWCWADGPEMRRDDEAGLRRWNKRAKINLYVP
jgi:hypothetical protein